MSKLIGGFEAGKGFGRWAAAWVLRQRFWPAAVLASVAFALFMEVVNIRFIAMTFVPVPFWDTWDNITPSQLFSRFFQHHNEHRIVIPRMFFIADAFLDGGRQVLPMLATHALVIANGCLVGLLARRLLAGPAAMQVALSAVFAGLFLSMQQLNILEWAFQVSWPLVYGFAMVAYLALFELEGRARLVAASGSALLAALSMANGALSLAPIIVLAAFLRDVRLLVFAALATVALLALQFAGLQPSQLPPFQGGALAYLVGVAHFALLYVGTPLTAILAFAFSRFGPDPLRMGGPGLAIALPTIVGALLVATFAALALREVLGRRRQSAALVLIATGGFVLVSALATATGRIGLGLQGAGDSRYGMGATLLTVCTAVLAARFAMARWRNGWIWVAAFTAAIMLASAMLQVRLAGRDRDWSNLRKLPAAAMLSGVDDDAAMRLVYPWKHQFPGLLAGVRESRLGVFADPWAAWLGHKLPLPVRRGACLGHVGAAEVVQDVPGARRLAGWATHPGHGLAAERVVITDRDATVVGYAFTGWLRPYLKGRAGVPTVYAGWYGYARPAAADPLTAYLLIDGGTAACPL